MYQPELDGEDVSVIVNLIDASIGLNASIVVGAQEDALPRSLRQQLVSSAQAEINRLVKARTAINNALFLAPRSDGEHEQPGSPSVSGERL